GHTLAHGLHLGVFDRQPGGGVDARGARLAAGGLAAAGFLVGGGLLLALLACGLARLRSFALGAQVGGGAGEVQREGAGEQLSVARDGGKHAVVMTWLAKPA